MTTSFSRREFLAAAGAALARGAKPVPVCAFSKHFQWAGVADAAQVIASLGYDGIDLTVRPRGHVLPERVADDLPKAVELARKAGIAIPMITTAIVDTATPHAEAILRTIASLGIRRYRWGGFRYDLARGLPGQLDDFRSRVKELAAMNRHYGVCAMYHTHSGIAEVGASMWDLYLLLKDFDPEAVSANYDIGHATVEGGSGGWIHSTRLLLPYMRGIAVKDFRWERGEKGWTVRWCPLGEGMVNFARFFSMVKESGFSGPVQVHMEYDELGGADAGRTDVSIPRDKLLAIMRRDMDALRRAMREAGLAA
jgi:sugar phosphate isomerase/epimerase